MNILRKIFGMNDTSLDDFLSSLYDCIMNDKIQNSYHDFNYTQMNGKNKLYKAIESYKNNETLFYADFLTKHPEINIKSIRNIRLGEHINRSLTIRAAYPTDTYYVEFTVYYEKKV